MNFFFICVFFFFKFKKKYSFFFFFNLNWKKRFFLKKFKYIQYAFFFSQQKIPFILHFFLKKEINLNFFP